MIIALMRGGKRMDKLISQQAAIDEIFNEPLYESGMKRRYADVVIPAIYEKIKSLPSAQPERKKGEWIYGEDDGQDGWYCSECNGFVPWDYEFYGLDNIDFIRDFKTCPFCDTKMITYTGADMRGEENAR
jgi:hypothetical protein